ncbi:hypothetical protein PtrM4_114050 [Pyrenophora tritici-repentis]|uniref:Uncharacterized protein n=1 Tax=Pyrenophora tritici-repentis TaxID=45151 RepID=A0A834VMC3_9PLEO|nr:hypothetical protein A1F99_081640 [Pyrenophora tritici-repentis]KAF7568990.1 hypothetical protein PtrM4_114050 [Pyrenophora tritici-repentis]
MRLNAISAFAALLASVQAIPQYAPMPELPLYIPFINIVAAEWCCAWVAGDYIGARPNWCQDNNGVSLC